MFDMFLRQITFVYLMSQIWNPFRQFLEYTELAHLSSREVLHGTVYRAMQNQLGFHNDNGPALIFADGYSEWWVDGKEITKDVVAWVDQMQLPRWPYWTNREKVLFKLRFG